MNCPGPAGEGREPVNPGCPRRHREAGAGCSRNHTGLKFPLLARRGRRRGGPRGKGKVGGSTANSDRGLRRDRRCSRFYRGQPVLGAQPWPGGGARPSVVLRGSAQRTGGVNSDPASQGHYPQPHLSPRWAWNPPQVPERRVWRDASMGSGKVRLGRWRRYREEYLIFCLNVSKISS